MIERLWHLEGSVAVQTGCNTEHVLDSLEDILRRQHKRKIARSELGLSFDDPLWVNFFVPNWLAMVIYDRGQFWIGPSAKGLRLYYSLRSLHGFVFCLVGSVVFCAAGWQAGGVLSGLGLATVAFVWLYGMNVLFALARVPGLIRQAARHE